MPPWKLDLQRLREIWFEEYRVEEEIGVEREREGEDDLETEAAVLRGNCQRERKLSFSLMEHSQVL